MLNWGIRTEVYHKLLEYGFEMVSLPQPIDPFFHARMRVCWEYLRDHHQEFRYVLWLDVKDLILQSDPSVWMEQNIGNKSIVASNECVTIEQEETNQLWARSILGEEKYQEIKDLTQGELEHTNLRGYTTHTFDTGSGYGLLEHTNLRGYTTRRFYFLL